jgi:hypothetical protein
MYVHIGGGYVVRDSDIIGFFDIDGQHTSEVTKEFLKKYESEARTDLAGDDLPRSFVLSDELGEAVAVLTHISTSAIKNRLSQTGGEGSAVGVSI